VSEPASELASEILTIIEERADNVLVALDAVPNPAARRLVMIQAMSVVLEKAAPLLVRAESLRESET
jgi:hypothetical protein